MTARVTTPFGAQSTADDVIAGVSLAGRRAVVTGGAGGLGRETARALAAAGADVTIASRDLDAASTAAKGITAQTGSPAVHAAPLDLADLGSVRAFARDWAGPLHILVNNAGIMATPEQRTPEGRELQFAVNHPDFTRDPYDPWLAYAQSKTANILFTGEAARRWAPDQITVNALNPGRIAGTGLSRHLTAPPASFDPAGKTGVSEKNVAQGAATQVLLAASPLVEGVTGRYFEDCQEAVRFTPGVRRGVAAYALDPASARRLWDLSAGLLTCSGEVPPRLSPGPRAASSPVPTTR